MTLREFLWQSMAAESTEPRTAVLPGRSASEVARRWPGARFGFGPGTRKSYFSAPVRSQCFIPQMAVTRSFSPRRVFLNWICSQLTLTRSTQMKSQLPSKAPTTEGYSLPRTVALRGCWSQRRRRGIAMCTSRRTERCMPFPVGHRLWPRRGYTGARTTGAGPHSVRTRVRCMNLISTQCVLASTTRT